MSVSVYLDFEKPLVELEKKISELEEVAQDDGLVIDDELIRLREKAQRQLRTIYSDLDCWQKTQVARHPDRPHFVDFRNALFEDWVELAGDRKYMDDQALLGGLARFRGRSIVLVGHEKGRTTQERVKHNFGMARPEGYRKTVRLMEMAQRYNLPVIVLIDTAGAYPGRGGEERGQAEALARSIETCLNLGTPIVTMITGEGASGGAVALAAGNKVLMMEHAIYTVISPEGASSILFRDSKHAREAARALRISAQDMQHFSIIDGIAEEPVGGAHRDQNMAMTRVGDVIESALVSLETMSPDQLRRQRKERFYAIGRKETEMQKTDLAAASPSNLP